MEAREESEDLAINKPERQLAGGDGASVTVELVGFLREEEKVKSGKALAGGETLKGFAIRELPFLIAEKNHHRGTEKEPAVDGGAKKQHGLKSGGDNNDVVVEESAEKGIAARELVCGSRQKHHHHGAEFHGGPKQRGHKFPGSDDHDSHDDDEARGTKEEGVAVQELAFLVAGKKAHGSHVNGDGKQQGVKLQGGNRELEVVVLAGQKQLRIDVPTVATCPTTIIEAENGTGENDDADSPDDEGGVVVILPQSDLTGVKRVPFEGDGNKTRKENSFTTAAEIEATDDDGRRGGKRKREGLEIAAREEHPGTVMRMPEVGVGGSGGHMDDDDDDDEDDDDLTRLKVVTVTADDKRNIGMSSLDDRNVGGTCNQPVHFPFKILSSLQRRARGEEGEASDQICFPKPISERAKGEEGGERYNSALAPVPVPPPQPPLLCNGSNKNVEEDVERTTPRHPRWTREETSVLLAGKRKRDEEMKGLVGSKIASRSAMRRWDSISAYCKSHGVDRDVHQCRKRWSNLAADFKKIRNWQKLGGGGDEAESYWAMKGDSRRKNKLPGTFDPQMFADMDCTSDSNLHNKKRKILPPEDTAPTDDSHRGGVGGRDPLASVLENSGRAMQAALIRSIQAQIEASNQNSELDRNQRKEQGDNLVGVLGKLAESLAKIAQRL